MQRSYLIQRLQKPYPPKKGTDHLRSISLEFGGGLPFGGIDKTVYTQLNRIFRFDYMGAAEFEHGAVPDALNTIYRYYAAGKGVKGRLCINGIPVYYLCHEALQAEVDKRIHEIAENKVRLKEPAFLDESVSARLPDNIDSKEKYKFYAEYIGWLELDNNFIFFLDKEPLENFTKFLDTLQEQQQRANSSENECALAAEPSLEKDRLTPEEDEVRKEL